MLTLTISSEELWDDENEMFLPPERQYTIQLEHSLLSLHKWESKWHKPFLGVDKKTPEENISYIECMIITPKFDYANLDLLTPDNIDSIFEYIKDPMTATQTRKKKGSNKETITSELLYCYMAMFHISWECQKWHLNQLIALINMCDIKSQPPEKMSQEEIMNRNARLNAERRAKLNSKG